MKQYKNKIIFAILAIAVLAVVFWWGGNAPGLQGFEMKSKQDVISDVANDNIKDVEVYSSEKDKTENDDTVKDDNTVPVDSQEKENMTDEKSDNLESEKTTDKEETEKNTVIESRPGGLEGGFTVEEKLKYAEELAGGSSEGVRNGDVNYSESQGMVIDKSTGKDKYLTDPVPDGKPVPVEPQDAVITDKELTCTLSVRCDTILNNIDWLDPEKVELVPKDGVIFAMQEITFYEGESVFNVLLREMKKNKIHMEFENTPIYNSAYIEGINNLYEFDCGELSGWMYKVNDWFPNYGCSRYQLKQGDIIEWVYTCNLGIDVGGYSSIGGE